MKVRFPVRPLLVAALVLSCLPVAASEKKFTDSDDAKKSEDVQEFLKDYDKLTKGKEADWVYFAPGFDVKSIKTVTVKPFTSGHGSRAKMVAEDAVDYVTKWIERQKLPWEVVKSGGDLTITGSVANAWEPSGGARFWGGWMANPGAVTELMGKAKGEIVFEMRQRSRGSTVTDAVENGIEKMTEELKKQK